MSIALLEDGMEFDGMDSSGKKTATRTMVFSYGENDSQMELAESPLLPSLGDVHPDYTLWAVESIDKPDFDEEPRRYRIKVKYAFGGDGGSLTTSGKKPWELGAVDFQTGTYEKEVPLRKIYQPDGMVVGYDENGAPIRGQGKWVDFKNTAGFRKTGKDTITILRISFTLHYKHKRGNILPAPTDYSFNARAEKICNFNIPPYAGKLLPFSTTLHTVYESNGSTVKYEYESANIVIEIMQDYTWINQFLNTGTLVLWKQTINGQTVMNPGAVYKYREISTYNESTFSTDVLQAPVKFGSLEQMIAQRQKFINANKGKDCASHFPYEEFTEEVPQKKDGTLYEEALKNPEAHPYLEIGGFLRAGQSWAKYNLPEKR